MAVILHGDYMASVLRHVDLVSKVVSELAPIHHRVAEEKIVRAKILRADNAILSFVQVRCTMILRKISNRGLVVLTERWQSQYGRLRMKIFP